MQLAIAKSGIDLTFMEKEQQDEFLQNHAVLFEDLEHRMISYLDKIEKAQLKVKSKDEFKSKPRSRGNTSNV